MEFACFDAGEVLRKEQAGQGPKNLRLLIGNPLILKEMARTVPEAAAYAPVTILMDERFDRVHLTSRCITFIGTFPVAASLPAATQQLSVNR